MDLTGSTTVVTGAARGIGRAMALRFAREGSNLALIDLRLEDLGETLSMVQAHGVAARAYAANVADEQAVCAVMERVAADFGRIDVLVNNAGGATRGSLAELDAAYRLNLRAPLAWSRLAIAAMGERGGSIVNVATLGAISLHPGMGAYGATKAGLIHLTRYLAAECGPRVRVNAVAPGLIRTDQSRAAWEGREARIATALPAGRLGEPADVAAAVAYLADPSNDWVTGETLAVDGGALVQLGRMRERR